MGLIKVFLCLLSLYLFQEYVQSCNNIEINAQNLVYFSMVMKVVPVMVPHLQLKTEPSFYLQKHLFDPVLGYKRQSGLYFCDQMILLHRSSSITHKSSLVYQTAYPYFSFFSAAISRLFGEDVQQRWQINIREFARNMGVVPFI